MNRISAAPPSASQQVDRRARSRPAFGHEIKQQPSALAILCLWSCLLFLEFSLNLQAAPGDKKWEFQTGGTIYYSSPAIGPDGTVYVGSIKMKVYALDGEKGLKKWEFQPEGNGLLPDAPAIGPDGTVYVGVRDGGSVYALDAATGAVKWRFAKSTRPPIVIGPDATLYVSVSDPADSYQTFHLVYALDGTTGKKLREFSLPGTESTGSPTTVKVNNWRTQAFGTDETVFCRTDYGMKMGRFVELWAVNANTGKKKWQINGSGYETAINNEFYLSAPAIGWDGMVYVKVRQMTDRWLCALDGRTGATNWVFNPPPVPNVIMDDLGSEPVIGPDGTVYLVGSVRVYAVDGRTGAERWEIQPGDYSEPMVPALGADGVLYVARLGGLYGLDSTTGTQIWKFPLSGVLFQSPTIGDNGTIYCGADNGRVYAFESGSTRGLADSSWSKSRGNAANTGAVEDLSTNGAPVFRFGPADIQPLQGAVAELMVWVGGQGPLQYQWFFEGAILLDATNAVLTWQPVQLEQAGNYFVTASNAFGMVTSRVARVSVEYGLTVTIQGSGAVNKMPDLAVYEPGQTVTLTALPTVGGQFVKWSGDVASGANPLVLTMDRHQAIVAQFSWVPGDKQWEFMTGGGVHSSPAIGADGTVYVGSEDRKVYALAGATGQKKWEFMTGDWVHSSPAIGADGTVYVGSEDRKVYALDGTTGQKKWQFTTGSYVETCPAIGADGTVYVGAAQLYALDGATGQKKWQSLTAPAAVSSSSAIGADGTVYVGADGLYALDGVTGRTKRRIVFVAGGTVISSPAIGTDDTVYVGARGKIYALDGLAGQKKWEFLTRDRADASPAIGADGTVYVGSYDYRVYALDGGTGRKKWQFVTGGEIDSSPAIGADGTVYIGSADGRVYALVGNSPGGLANSPWPKFRCNAQNTGNVQSRLRITAYAESRVCLAGSSVELAIETAGIPIPALQWFWNGQQIPGATNAIYALNSITEPQAGTYTVLASNVFGTVTSDPAIVAVNNVVASRNLGLILTAPAGAQLQVQQAAAIPGPWQLLTNLTLPTGPYAFVDESAPNAQQRFYRTTNTNRLDAYLLPGWTFTSPAGSQHRVEYLEAPGDFSQWHFLTNLTLPESPYLFIDTTATNRLQRYYRTTPVQ